MRTIRALAMLLFVCILLLDFGYMANSKSQIAFVQSFEDDGLAMNFVTNFSFSKAEAHSGSRSLLMSKDSDVTNTNSFVAVFENASDMLSSDEVYRIHFYLKPVYIESTVELQFFRNSTVNSYKGNNSENLVRKFNLTSSQLENNYEKDENGWYKIIVVSDYQIDESMPYMNLWCCQWDKSAEFYIDDITFEPLSASVADSAEAEQVTTMINKLPDTVSFFNKSAVVNAYDVYSTLNDATKELVTNSKELLESYAAVCNMGDMTADGEIDIRDLVRMKRSIVSDTLTQDALLRGDLDADGSISSNDTVTLAKILLGIYNMTYYYDLQNVLEYYWEGNAVYNEAVCFECKSDGTLAPASLMYTPDMVVSVRSVDLNTLYTEGVDYVIDGKNIILTENSAIKAVPYDTQYPEYASGASSDWLQRRDDSGRYTALVTLRDYQVAVTYIHSDTWTGEIPETQLSLLTRTKEKLENGDELKIVFYGDSITAGYEASGQTEYAMDKTTLKRTAYIRNLAPYLPAWTTLVTQGLKVRYPESTVTSVNLGAPSSGSKWGITNVNLLEEQEPDLAVIAFGMNEAMAQADFKNNIAAIIEAVVEACPDVEILLASACVPNSECTSFYNNKLAVQEDLLCELKQEYQSVNIAVAKVQSLNLEMIEMGKKVTDGLNNNLNHPNDFIIRLYAQTILKTLS